MVASGMQSPEPIVPSIVGGVILVYAASTRGALSAFRLIDRRVHRWFDPVLIALQIAASLQPWVGVNDGTRFIMIAIALVHGVVWWGSSFHEKQRPSHEETTTRKASPATASADRSTELGKKAGRAVGVGVKMVRKAKAKRES